MARNSDKIFNKVLFLGPQRKGAKGGIAAVLDMYGRNIKHFHYLPTNSAHGTLAGVCVLLATLSVMPLARLAGRRIAHIHYASGKSWIRKKLVWRWARLLGFRTVMHNHSGGFARQVEADGAVAIRRCLGRADANVCLNQERLDMFVGDLGLSNAVIINNPVERPVPAADSMEKYAAPERVEMVFLGKLCRNKGVYDMLEAARRLKAEGLRFHISVGGNGEVEEFKARVAEAGLGDCVEYAGWVDAARKDALLRRAHVLLLPSYIEGLPISILEAMAYSTAVISTPVGGIPSLIEPGVDGQLAAPGDVDALADAMRRYISNPAEARQHALHARSTVEPYYIDHVTARLAELYRTLL